VPGCRRAHRNSPPARHPHRRAVPAGSSRLRQREGYWGQGEYLEVDPPQRIRFTWSWTKDRPDGENLHPQAPVTEVKVEFLERHASTEVVLTHTGFTDAKQRQEHDRGWNGCLDVLENVLV
jgi:uncharacterized protein YndB with AHSA1/START domain